MALSWTPKPAAAKVREIVACVTLGIERSGYLELNRKLGRNRYGLEEIRICLGGCGQRAGECLPI